MPPPPAPVSFAPDTSAHRSCRAVPALAQQSLGTSTWAPCISQTLPAPIRRFPALHLSPCGQVLWKGFPGHSPWCGTLFSAPVLPPFKVRAALTQAPVRKHCWRPAQARCAGSQTWVGHARVRAGSVGAPGAGGPPPAGSSQWCVRPCIVFISCASVLQLSCVEMPHP